jgi:hypothetical protein
MMRCDRREFEQPNRAGKSVVLRRVKGMPKKVGRGMPEMPLHSAGQGRPVDQDEADDLAEGERDDGEIVAAQAQHRKAEQDAPERRQDAGQRQADPERQPKCLASSA